MIILKIVLHKKIDFREQKKSSAVFSKTLTYVPIIFYEHSGTFLKKDVILETKKQLNNLLRSHFVGIFRFRVSSPKFFEVSFEIALVFRRDLRGRCIVFVIRIYI